MRGISLFMRRPSFIRMSLFLLSCSSKLDGQGTGKTRTVQPDVDFPRYRNLKTDLIPVISRLTVILNGLIRITSPAPARNASQATPSPSSPGGSSGDEASEARPAQTTAYIQPGTVSSSLVIAADLKNASVHAGHFTEFPGDEPTVLVQVPFAGDAAPEHAVLGEGPCQKGSWGAAMGGGI